MTVDIGDKAPDFKLPTDGGGELKLSSLKGRKVVLYFYPKDMTPGCKVEAEGFRDAVERFRKSGAEVIGVSKDSTRRHDTFKAKHDLNFALVADEGGTACGAYGVWVEKSNYGRKYMGIERATFLIDEKGRIARVWRNVRVKDHVDEVLAAVEGR